MRYFLAQKVNDKEIIIGEYDKGYAEHMAKRWKDKGYYVKKKYK